MSMYFWEDADWSHFGKEVGRGFREGEEWGNSSGGI